MDYIWWLNIEYLLRECTERVLNYDNIDRTLQVNMDTKSIFLVSSHISKWISICAIGYALNELC